MLLQACTFFYKIIQSKGEHSFLDYKTCVQATISCTPERFQLFMLENWDAAGDSQACFPGSFRSYHFCPPILLPGHPLVASFSHPPSTSLLSASLIWLLKMTGQNSCSLAYSLVFVLTTLLLLSYDYLLQIEVVVSHTLVLLSWMSSLVQDFNDQNKNEMQLWITDMLETGSNSLLLLS